MGLMNELNERKKKQGTTTSKPSSGGLIAELNLRKKYQSLPVDDVDDKYIKTFASDANNFFKGLEKDRASYYDSSDRVQDLNTRYDTIQGWLYKNKSQLDEETYKGISSAFDGFKSSLDSVSDYYSQWSDRDEYLTWDAKETFVKNYMEDPDKALQGDYDEEWLKEAEYRAEVQKVLGAEDFEAAFAAGEALGADPTEWWKNAENTVAHMRSDPEYLESYESSANASDGASLGLAKNTLLDSIEYKAARYMTDDEYAVYNYYVGKGDTEKAEAYLYSIEDYLNQRQAGRMVSDVQGNKMSEMIFAFEAGMNQFVTGIGNLDNLVMGKEADPISAVQYANAQIGSDQEGGWKVAYDLATTTSNMLPSILVSMVPVVGQAAGVASMGASAAGNAYAEMRNLGYDEKQAQGYSVLVGASEATLQYLLGGISKLGGKVSSNVIAKVVDKVDNAIARVAIDLGGNMLSEGVEEAVQSVLEPIFKALTTGEEFEGVDIEEAVYSGLLGMLSAGVLEGGGTIVGTAISGSEAKQNYGNGAELVTEALEIDPNNTYAQKLKAKLDSGKTLSGLEINRLVEMNESGMVANDTAAIREAAISRLTELGEEGDVEAIATALTKQASGEKLSVSERYLIRNSMNGQRVANELKTENIQSGEYTSAWAEKIGTDRINAEEYGRLIAELETEDAAVAPASNVHETPKDARYGSTEAENAEITTDTTTDEAKAVPVTDSAPVQEIATEDENEASVEVEESPLTIEDASQKYGAQAGAMVHTYTKGQDVAKYDSAYKVAYDMGKSGVSLSYVMNSDATAYLTEKQKELAYETGKAATVSKKERVEDASEQEKTVKNTTGEEADVQEIASVEDGEVMVRLGSGEVVNAKDISFGSSEEGSLYARVSDMKLNAEAANAFVRGYDADSGLSVADYAAGFSEAYRHGQYGLPLRELSRDGLASKLTQAQREIAYRLGQEDAKNTVSEKQKAVGKRRVASKKEAQTEKGKVHYEFETDGMTERQLYSLMGLEEIAKALGIDFYIFESEVGENGKRKGANGWYDPKDGSIHIDLYAGLDGEGTILFTAAHELTHLIRDWSPAKFKVFADFLLEQYGKHGVSVNTLVQRQIEKAKKNGRNISYDTAYEEVIADACETMLTDGDVLQKITELKAKDKSLWQKIKDYILGLASKIKKVYEGLSPDSVEGQYVAEMVDVTARLKELWTEALADASEAYAAASTAEGAVSGGEMLSTRDADYMAAVDRGDTNTAQRLLDAAAKEAGYTSLYYHGAKNGGGFHVFRDWSYFTGNKQYAERYASRDKADSLYTTYVRLEKPFDTRKAKDRKLFAEIRQEYGLGEIQDSGLPDWTDGYDISDYIDEHDLDYDGIILDEGGDLVDGKPVSRGLSYVIRKSAQVKSADPIIYDDLGNVIPLSERFDAEEEDIRYSDRDFAAQVDAALNGADTNSSHLKLMDTPKLLQEAGLPDLPILMTAQHLKSITSKSGKGKKNYHGLDVDVVKKLPEYISDPVMIADSLTRGDSVVIITEAIDSESRPVIAAILLDGSGRIDGEHINANIMTSAYGKDNFQSFLNRLADSNSVIYWNEKKSQDLSVSLGIQFPNAITSLNSSTIIHQSKAFVNREISENDIKLSDRDDLMQAKDNLERYRIDTKEVVSLADNYLKNYSGSMSKTQVRTEFLRVTEDMAKAMSEESVEQMSEVNQRITELAAEIVNHPSITGELADNLREIKQHLRKTRIKIPQDNKGDFDAVGGFENFRRRHIGSFILANDGLDVDVLYSELQELFGVHWFPEGIDHVADQLMMIAEVSDTPLASVSDTVEDTDKATSHVAGHILEKLMEAVENGQKSLTDGSRYENGGYSNRSLLANALETVAQNDIEKKRLQEYKRKIGVMEAEQAKLNEIRAEIKALSFAKGQRDTVKLRELRDQATRLANRITVYDSQLLNLEASTALKNVLQREKQKAYKKAEQEGKEALAAYRERALQKQREISERYQESRKKGAEGRKKTEMRHKIQKVVSELNQYLLKGTKERHVPIELQKAVAEALNAVNMDTVGAEQRIAKLNDELLKAKTPEKIQEISRKIDNIREQGDRMDGKLTALKEAYNKFVDSDDPMIANSHDPVIANKLESVIDDIGETPLRDMTMKQLEDVYDMYKMVLTTIRIANKTFKSNRSESIAVLGERVMEEIRILGKESKKEKTKLKQAVESADWNNLKPTYAVERIGSEAFTEIFDNVRAGEDIWAKDMSEANEYRLDKQNKYKYDTWDFNQRFTFKSASGKEFELSLDQIMSLYAYSKREQAGDHLRYGGFVYDGLTEVKKKTKLGIEITYQLEDSTAYNLSEETLAEIVGKLTPDQKSFADEMQDYLSTDMSEKGNEVSLALYDVKLYKERHYWPLKSAPQYLKRAREQAEQTIQIKNYGFSKETKPHAKNPIVLTSFMETWANHVNEMSMYHAFVLPMEDFYRVYNYKIPASLNEHQAGVIPSIDDAHGKAATKYIDQLLKDLNGGAITDPREGFGKAMISKFKKASVMASMSVVIQQPTAIVRAMSLVDPMYFVGQKVEKARHDALWAEVKKYAPVAVIKEMGYFDTNMGRSAKDFLTAKEYRGIPAKLKGFFTDSNYRDEVFAWAPAKADELGWTAIWNAVKRETLHKHKSLAPNSEEFLRLVGERFTEVITRTQVYDSVLARSGNMRSKSAFMSMATSFMGEPTTTLNMVSDAVRKFTRGDKKGGARAIAAVAGSMILNSALVSLVYAMRDDDEDETYLEKYLSALSVELLEGVNPLNYIPFAKDIWSIFIGYDVERGDMSLISDLADSLKKVITIMSKDTDGMDEEELAEYEKQVAEAWMTLPDSVASILGIPVKNIRREINGIVNFIDTAIKDATERDTTLGSLGDALQEDLKGALPVVGWLPGASKGDKLYDAIVSGDTEYVERLTSGYETQSSLNSALRKALRENDDRIKEAAQAVVDGDFEAYTRLVNEIVGEGHFSEENITAAINAEVNSMTEDEDTEEAATVNETSLYKMEWLYMAIADGDASMADTMKEDLIQTAVLNGKEREEAEKSFNTSFTSYLQKQYEAGALSDYDAQSMLIEYGGKSEEDAASKVRYWAFKRDYPDINADDAWISEYYEEVEYSGLAIEIFVDYRNQVKSITGEDKKAMRMAVIDSLPISSEQKDALYFAEGWAESKINEAPWR